MRRLRASLVAATTVVATLAAAAPPVAAGAPVCTDPIPRELCGGRVFPEPLQAASGLTYRQLVAGMEQLAADHPTWLTFEEFGEGSADGHALWVAEVTAPEDEEGALPMAERRIVLVNQSIHGNEPGGREGAPRYVEDLLLGTDATRRALLGRIRLVQTFMNPDGWTAGDHDHVQTGGGVGLWARQNGAGPFSGAGDLGFGIDLNRQAPWFGTSHTTAPQQAPEAIAFVDLVRGLRAEGEIAASVDIHGEITDAYSWTMLSSGQFDLDDSIKQRLHGEKLDEDLRAALEDSAARELIETIEGENPISVVTASSEFGSIARESTASGTGFTGDWISQVEGGGSASLSTIELYNFAGTPGLNSLTARREVMQLYRDTVAGILGSLIDSAALEHDSTIALGDVLYVDDAPRFADPVRTGVTVSSADFFRDLAPQVDGSLTPVQAADLAAGIDADSVVVTTDRLASSPAALAALRAYAEGGGNVVLTDAALRLLPSLTDAITAADLSVQVDNGGKVSYDRSHPLADGIREIAWMNTETATMGRGVGDATRAGDVPTHRVDRAVWEAAGGTTAGVSGTGRTSVGELPVGDGTIRTIGVLLPDPDPTAPRITYGINGYGVLDTGYVVFANALGSEVDTTTVSAFDDVEPIGTMAAAEVGTAPVAPVDATPLRAALVLLLGSALTVVAARRDRGPDGSVG